ncbi:type II toxin-antitoxin system RelE/ParE family toxin [Amedibacillus dolichus]|uniref:Toxin-antitoxin system, toxin component, RelE family n=1 Tax=Amedibacillus dolichus DSM 3991 TaxID=428127 RepID=A8RAC6_9FIRM|nr:type II toxin-antitoxin system RelE/ParE family toxin [Amedibacillus dolichus]EDP11594.1 toxin-antitoxin system, toxin component, RelE family [Amedibacillus dolichus DSM 3991]
MKFAVELTEKADRDLRNIFLYIKMDLCAPAIAEKQIKRLWKAILSLDELPERYRRYEKELVLCQDFGQLKYKNFQFLV